MKLELVISAKVLEDGKNIGDQEITMILPDTSDLQGALSCLSEGQINFSKIAEQVGIAAVWMGGRTLQKRIEAEHEASLKKDPNVEDLG